MRTSVGAAAPTMRSTKKESTAAHIAGKLDSQAALLLIVLTLFNAANAFSGLFVPVYLFKAHQSYALVGWFSLLQYFSGGVCIYLAGAWVKQKGLVAPLRLGIALSGIFYLSVLLLGESSRSFAIPLGILNGVSGGFFWLAYNVLYFESRRRTDGIASTDGLGF